jgi:hypothetical protein
VLPKAKARSREIKANSFISGFRPETSTKPGFLNLALLTFFIR